MPYVKRHHKTVTTAADGSATVYTGEITGKIVSITYTKTDYDAGVDFAITGEDSGIDIWSQNDVNSTVTVAPKMPTHTQAGVANDTAGDVLLSDIYIAQERIEIKITGGGSANVGDFDIIVAGPSG